jgi:hypothetical protein
VRRLARIAQEVVLPDRIDHAGGPHPGLAARDLGRTLARQFRDKATTKHRVLSIEPRRARRIRQFGDLAYPSAKRGWYVEHLFICGHLGTSAESGSTVIIGRGSDGSLLDAAGSILAG